MSALAHVQLHLVNSLEKADEFRRWFGERRDIICVDTETEGLHWWRDRARLIQIGDRDQGWAFPWRGWGGAALSALRRYNGRIVTHNGKFDCHMIEHWSHELDKPFTFDRSRIDDTRVMSHILEPTQPTGLKNVTRRYVDPQSARAQQVLEEGMAANGWTWATVPYDFEPYWAYGALDTVLTCRLYEVLQPRVAAEAPAAYDLEMATTWVIERMESRGCRLDVEWTTAKRDAFRHYVDESGAWVQSTYGVSAGSDGKVIERLQRDGVEFTKLTPKGTRFSLDREVLDAIDHPLAKVVLQRRRLQKLTSTYLDNFLELAQDGVIHPGFNTLANDDSGYGARTGRMSVSEPSLQNLPRKNNASPQAIAVRNCITASEDSTLVMCDFAQIEMRMLAHLANDDGLRQAFTEGDFFTNVARELYGDPGLVKDDPRRQLTKNGMYALSYGAGGEKIALTTGQELAIVQEFLNGLAVRFPGIKQLQRTVEHTARQRRIDEGDSYVRSPLTGRRHTCDEGKEYTLVNYLIQGTAAEVLKLKNVELAAAGLDEFMILDVHDEVILDVPNDQVDDVAPVLGQVMHDDKLFTVPLTVSVDRAFRWGEKGG